MILDSILQAIGKTPIVRLKKLSSQWGVRCYAKLESLNPGGSHKARIALGMVLDAERRGILVRGSGQTIIEPSGGNTGIGLAMVCNLLGYKLILVIPDNYSVEKQKLLRLYGAEVVSSESKKGNNSHGEKAMEMQLCNPHLVMLNQQRNEANPETHRQTTVLEILEDFEAQDLDVFVAGIGTGGHITGIGEVLKRHQPNMRIIGVEPEGCDLLANVHASHGIQGLSIGLIPKILNIDLIDQMVKVSESECIQMARRVMRLEGISIGISSAANFVAVEKIAPRLPKNCAVLTMVYDGAESYLNMF
jgi:cysteine synthase